MYRKYRLSFLFLLFLIQVSVASEVEISPKPEWVTPVSFPKNKNKSDEAAITYLLSDQQYNLNQKGIAYYQKVVLEINNLKGLEQASELTFSFNENFQRLILHNIDVIRNGKLLNRLNLEDIKTFSSQTDLEQRQYNGVKTALAILKDIRVGDLVEYAYTIDGFNPIFGGKRFGLFNIDWSTSIVKQELRVHTSQNRSIYFNELGKKYQKEEGNKGITYAWYFENRKAIFDEGEYPSWYLPYAFIEFSEYKNWSEVREWAETLYSEASLSDEILEKIEQWKNESSSRDEVLGKALQFVQDEIRYFGIEVGDNTHKPNKPSDVFKSRFGDCKDKTNLLQAIFQHLNVKSSPALVSTSLKRSLDERIPSPLAFNHVILKAEIEGKSYWLDGTMSFQRGGLENIGRINLERALVLDGKSKQLTKVKREKSRSKIVTQETYKVSSFSEPVELIIKNEFYIAQAERYRYILANLGKEVLSKNFLNFYSKYYPGIEMIREIEIVDDVDNNKLAITEHYLIKNHAKQDSGKWKVNIFASLFYEYLIEPQIIQRKMPFEFPFQVDVTQAQEIILPDSKLLYIDTEDKSMKNKYFDYERKSTYENNVIRLEHHYVSKKEVIEPDEVGDYKEAKEQVLNEFEFVFVSQGNHVVDGKTQNSRVTNLLKKLMKN